MRPRKFGEAPLYRVTLSRQVFTTNGPADLPAMLQHCAQGTLVNTGNGGSLTTGQAVANWLPTGVGAAGLGKQRKEESQPTQWSLTASINLDSLRSPATIFGYFCNGFSLFDENLNICIRRSSASEVPILISIKIRQIQSIGI